MNILKILLFFELGSIIVLWLEMLIASIDVSIQAKRQHLVKKDKKTFISDMFTIIRTFLVSTIPLLNIIFCIVLCFFYDRIIERTLNDFFVIESEV